MPPTPYFSTVTSDSAFRTRFQAEDAKTFSELENVSASSWGRAHLLGCRVVRREPLHNLLPILSQYTPSEWPPLSNEITSFLQGPDLTLMAESEHSLVRNSSYGISLAQIWAAMAMFKGGQDRRVRDLSITQREDESELGNDAAGRQSTRVRRQIVQPDFIDSSEIHFSSSPPQGSLHGGSQGSSLGYVDLDTHQLGITPEDDTLRLVSCVIRHILYFAPPQVSASRPIIVEFRDAKTRVAALTSVRNRQIVAIDDGGLCLRRQKPGEGFMLANNYVAILEAKTQFQSFQDGRPIISDRSLAQMVCEGLATRLSSGTGGTQQR
ncbi:hypothetical protein N7527_012039 [Penicillium freii]|nr:hypothetical protein N7527_012039 [Penicillium freii]